MANTGDARKFGPLSADSDPFTIIVGGNFAVTVTATWNSTGTVTLEALAADGTTYAPVNFFWAGGPLASDGLDTAWLAPGTYKFAVDTATGVYLAICRVDE